MNRLTDKLSEAICIAATAHQHQTHAGGSPYILHVMRVVERARLAGGDETTLIVAALHDVLEDDCTASFGDLVMRFGPVVGEALNAITRRPSEPYAKYIQRVHRNAVATAVKLADLEDNRAAALRYPVEAGRQEQLTAKYEAAWEVLTGNGAHG